MRRPILAATDFSHDGDAAVRYAADLATRLHHPLLVMHVVPVMTPSGPTITSPVAVRRGLRRARRRGVELAEEIRGSWPDLPVTVSIAAGDAVYLLAQRAHQAHAVVVGARGFGGHPALRWGSVSNRLASRSHCPVFVVRADARPRTGGPVVVAGTDPGSDVAAAYAGELLRPGPSYVVTVHPDGGPRVVDPDCGGLPADRMIVRVAADGDRLSGATVEAAARCDAALVIVARARHPWPFRFDTDSLVHTLIEEIDCPVAVVDPAVTDPAAPALAGAGSVADR